MQTQVDTKQLRTFGLLVGGIFALIGLWPVVLRSEELRLWPVVMAVLLLVPALVLPGSLGLVYRLWMRLGHVLGWINTKILLGVIFYGVITPLGLIRRVVLGKDALLRAFDPKANTYRMVRQERPKSHMVRQF